MTLNLQDRCGEVSTNIKAAAITIRQTIFDQIMVMQASLPASFHELSATNQRELIEELRAGLNIWVNEINPVVAQLRQVLLQLHDELSQTTWP